jgi:hypothetical protein
VIFFVHETGDRHPNDVRNRERHGDVREEAVQFAESAFSVSSPCLSLTDRVLASLTGRLSLMDINRP